MSVMDTRTVGERLAELPAHEAFAVFARLYEELVVDAKRLAHRVEEFEGLDVSLAKALGAKSAASAGMAFLIDANAGNEAYLVELVARVKGGDDV